MNISKLFKSINFKKKTNSSLSLYNANRDWYVILIAGMTVFILNAFFCWKLNVVMLKVSEVGSQAGEKDKVVITVNRGAMNELVDSYKNQESLFESTKKSLVNKADPSK